MTYALMYGPVVGCLDRSVYPYAGRKGWACRRCGGYHDANARPLRGPCANPRCCLVSGDGGAMHVGECFASYTEPLGVYRP